MADKVFTAEEMQSALNKCDTMYDELKTAQQRIAELEQPGFWKTEADRYFNEIVHLKDTARTNEARIAELEADKRELVIACQCINDYLEDMSFHDTAVIEGYLEDVMPLLTHELETLNGKPATSSEEKCAKLAVKNALYKKALEAAQTLIEVTAILPSKHTVEGKNGGDELLDMYPVWKEAKYAVQKALEGGAE